MGSDDQIRSAMRRLLGEDRQPSISHLMRIFSSPGAKAVKVRERISTEVLRGSSTQLLSHISRGSSDLVDSGPLVEALREKREIAEGQHDQIMIEMIDAVDVALLCIPLDDKWQELEKRARAQTKITTIKPTPTDEN